MNLYHIKLTDNQKSALEHLFSRDIEWNKTELETAWNRLRVQLKEAVQCVSLMNSLRGLKPTKYDPCRKLRKGDIVKACTRDGRAPYGRHISGSKIELDEERLYMVTRDEDQNGVFLDPIFDVRAIAHTNFTVDALYLELVTPVEESAPFSVSAFDGILSVRKKEDFNIYYPVAWFSEKTHPNAKAAAEAECARLNSEWRKELQ